MINFFHSTISNTQNPPVENDRELLLWFWGESNSGGMALNEDASASELGIQPQIQIYHNGFVRQIRDMIIGGIEANNLMGHTGFTTEQAQTMHGWELQYANLVKSNYFLKNVGYLVKTGQGGSTIGQWAEGTSFTNTCISRVNGIKYVLDNMPVQHETYMIASIGINDAVAHTDATVFYNGVIDFFNRMRTLYGEFPIIMTRIMRYNSYFEAIDDAIMQLGNDLEYVTVVNIDGLELENNYHWSYIGMKELSNRMMAFVKNKYN